MADLVSSAIVQETVCQIVSGLVQKYEEKEESNMKRNLERLEMAHIRLEAALETSDKWKITDPSLLRWRRKLKHAAQECNDTLHKCKKRIVEDEQIEQEVKDSSFPNRIVHATKFEWYADGASEFLRFIELGGTPRHHMPFDSLVKNLFTGKELHHKILRGNKNPLCQLWLVPARTSDYGTNATLVFIQYDDKRDVNVQFSFFAPHFKCTFENIRHEVIQLLTQDYSWSPPINSRRGHWEKIHSFICQWTRPNPFCCKQHGCKEKTSPSENIISLQDYPYLKAWIFFGPHGSSENMLPVNRSSEIAEIVRKEQHCLHTDITLEQLEEIMLPKAIQYFHENAEAMVYQMLWTSKHGFALIQVEKPCMGTQRSSTRTRSTLGRLRKRNLLQEQDEAEHRARIHLSRRLTLCVQHIPIRLQRLFMNWLQKEKEIQLAAQSYLKF
ncbi:hypothetical protein HU200_040797 [Digitaria exilis]|uniref:Rx N-terminal domain-containing protein n=1 Tax=Digitaria exilis TaxID=1010633 RepID=A0A835BIT2_9POAL|nr:hypothetical protein HU200_040797 [Digitaria exilis]